MADNAPDGGSPSELARRLETISADIHELETHLPAPLSLAGARHELTLTAGACRCLADGPIETETTDEQERDASTDASEEPSGGE